MRFATLILFLSGTVHAATIFDQGFDTGDRGGNAVLANQWLWQSFQVGIEGTLHQVKLHLFRGTGADDDLTLYVTNADAMDYVSKTRIPISTVPMSRENGALVTVDLGRGAPDLQLGSRYGLVLVSLETSLSSAVNWTRDLRDQYPNGTAGVIQGQRFSRDGGGVDQTFQTLMEPRSVSGPPAVIGIVPEPSTLWLLVLGIACFLMRRDSP